MPAELVSALGDPNVVRGLSGDGSSYLVYDDAKLALYICRSAGMRINTTYVATEGDLGWTTLFHLVPKRRTK